MVHPAHCFLEFHHSLPKDSLPFEGQGLGQQQVATSLVGQGGGRNYSEGRIYLFLRIDLKYIPVQG